MSETEITKIEMQRMAAVSAAALIIAAATEEGTAATFVADETVTAAKRLMAYMSTGQ